MEEKIKVAVSYRTYALLLSDMESFGFYRGEEVNRNAFLNRLIASYFPLIQASGEALLTRAQDILKASGLAAAKAEMAAHELLPLLGKRGFPRRDASLPLSFSFRPNREGKPAIVAIEDSYLSGRSMSEFLRYLFDEYVSLPPSEREAILFSEAFDILSKAAREQKSVYILLDGKRTLFDPYAVVPSPEGLYTYAVGYVSTRLYSFHLYKMDGVLPSGWSYSYDPKRKKAVEEGLRKGADYFLGESRTCTVRLSKGGVKMLRQFWHNRPRLLSKDGNVYTFEGASEQIFNYFLRFGPTAKIIAPESLKQKTVAFLEASLKNYRS